MKQSNPKPPSPVHLLQSKLGVEWTAITRAMSEAETTVQKLERLLTGTSSSDVCVVAFGSLGRKEWTRKSDVDWTLLIDGQADPQHLEVAQQVASRLQRAAFVAPGTSGVFGSMTFSHDLVQKIGGREDTNENTTRRVLLLQESVPLGKPDARERVLRLILSRYLTDDRGLTFGSLPFRVPRFLLNDIVRYWRTLTVDFVEKQRGQAGQGWGLRNAKLRMSRKLILASGLLTCFSCQALECSAAARKELEENHSTVGMEEHLKGFMRMTPLEVLATFLLELKIRERTTTKLFSSYNSFLELLNDTKKREHLKRLHYDRIPGDKVFAEARKYSRSFQEGLTDLFFNDHEELRKLTVFYGVF